MRIVNRENSVVSRTRVTFCLLFHCKLTAHLMGQIVKFCLRAAYSYASIEVSGALFAVRERGIDAACVGDDFSVLQRQGALVYSYNLNVAHSVV